MKKISNNRKVKVQKAISLMAPGLVNFMFTDLVWRLYKKSLPYKEAMNYLEERMSHISSKELYEMWASRTDYSFRKNLYKECWLLAKELHECKIEATTVSDFYSEIYHLFNIGELLKQK